MRVMRWFPCAAACGGCGASALVCRLVDGEELHKLPKERLHFRLSYIVDRFATHAPHWQFLIWLRQFLLWFAATLGDYFSSSVYSWRSPFIAQFVSPILALLVLSASWYAHTRTSPFAYRFQNGIESFLYLANILLLFLALRDALALHSMRSR